MENTLSVMLLPIRRPSFVLLSEKYYFITNVLCKTIFISNSYGMRFSCALSFLVWARRPCHGSCKNMFTDIFVNIGVHSWYKKAYSVPLELL